jgi:hypothetical protein
MAKRFIDTNLFSDEWFNGLSKDGKLFFVYFITTCDHAGILKLNKRLCEFQTEIKSMDTVIEELGNSLVTLKEGLIFMPKFIKFQYPNFPKSNVKQQESALKILISHGVEMDKLKSYLTVREELVDSYVNEHDNVSDNVSESESAFGKSENLLTASEDELMANVIWLNDVCSLTRLKSLEEGKVWLSGFIKEIKAKQNFNGRTRKDVMSHFVSWLKIELGKSKSKKGNGKSTLEGVVKHIADNNS